MHWWNSGFGMGWLWMILWLAIIIGIAAVIIFLLISQVKKQNPPENNIQSDYNKAAAILKERYARGEITHEEFKQMLEDIKD